MTKRPEKPNEVIIDEFTVVEEGLCQMSDGGLGVYQLPLADVTIKAQRRPRKNCGGNGNSLSTGHTRQYATNWDRVFGNPN